MSETQAATLGAELRRARQALGWELPHLAASLRIRQSYLEAIEAGRVGDLPGTTYALGFVRTYATALGLPGEDVARRFRSDSAMANAQTALRFPAPVPQRGVPAGALMLLGLLILAGAYAGWYFATEHRATPTETVPPIPDRLEPHEAAKPSPSPQVATLLPATSPPAPKPAPSTPPAPAQVPASPAAGAQPGPGIQPQPGAREANAPAPSAPTPAAPPANTAAAPGAAPVASGAQAPAAQAQAAPQPAAAPGGDRIMIKTTADAWVTVKSPGGPALLNKLMHAGETWPVPADKAGLTLTTGNAGGTELDVDGAPIPTALGGSGAVRRDLPLDPDMLKSGKLPPAPARRRPKPVAPAADE